MRNLSVVRDTIAKLNIMDDLLFQKMAEDTGFCEETISTIIGEQVEVIQVTPQNSIKNLQGRSVILDALCKLKTDQKVNVEVQNDDHDDHQKRIRYHASCITANITDPGVAFEKVPDVIIIYISNFDLFKSGKTVYHIDRIVRENGQIVHNGLTEIYVNAKADDGSDLAKLMKIYTETDFYDFKRFPKVSKRKAEFKIEKGGERKMGSALRDIAKEWAQDMAQDMVRDKEKDMVIALLNEGIPMEKLTRVVTILTPEEVRKIAG